MTGDFECCVPVGPDCRDGKHPACDGRAWDEHADGVTSCRCGCHRADGSASASLRLTPGEVDAVLALRALGVQDAAERIRQAAMLEAAAAPADAVLVVAKVSARGRVHAEDIAALGRAMRV